MYEHSNNNKLSWLSVCPCAEEPQARSACMWGKSSINNNVYFVKLPFRVINTSYQSRKSKMESLYFMEAVPKLHPSSLLTDSLGGACLYLIYMLKTETNPNLVLLCPWVNNSLPFIWLPCSDALSIIASSGLNRIYAALEACEKLRKVPLVWGEWKHIFTNYGKRVMYTCVGNQVLRNSPQVLEHAPF